MNKKEFLLDTLNYYVGNPHRRCINEGGGCYYNPENAGNHNSEGCAVGRHLPKEAQVIYDEIETFSSGYLDIIEEIEFNMLGDYRPDWMRRMPDVFVWEVQTFHDSDINWNEYGMTPDGKKELQKIISRFIDEKDRDEFKKFL